MVLFSNAKINIGLNIINKRKDGYHNLESVFYPIPFYDVIEFTSSKVLKIDFYGKCENISTENNLIKDTVKLFNKEVKKINGLEIKVLKNIPTGSGLGGGSSNAANLLIGLNQFYRTNLSNKQLLDLSLMLGSDCPFFINNFPAFVTGRGENISKLPFSLKGYRLIICIPRLKISTKSAFNLWKKNNNKHISLLEAIRNTPEKWKIYIKNDFEELLFSDFQILKKIKQNLYSAGAIYSSLSGSGSAVYGIFHKNEYLIKKVSDEDCYYFNL